MRDSQAVRGVAQSSARRRCSYWILTGAATTGLAVIVSLMMTAFVDSFDLISPPLAAVGFACCTFATVSDCRPRMLARGMLGLNMLYWIYFCVLLSNRS